VKRQLCLFTLFATEIAVITALSLPSLMLFRNFAFADWGTNFTLQYLLSTGLLPNIDFGYPYGNLALLFGHLWFSAIGATPNTYAAAMLICNLLVAWAIALLMTQLQLNGAALVLVFVTLPYAMQVLYPNFAQAIESVLLTGALAAQACRRRGLALGLVAAGCFAKPSLSYVYGLILLVLILWDLHSQQRLTLPTAVRALAPAGLCMVGLFLILALGYGADSTARTLLPTAGAANYRAFHYGFFTGTGRLFWWPTDAGWGYYLTTIAGFWLAGTIWLLGNGVRAAYRWWLGIKGDAGSEMVLTCAILQLAFVTLMFGSRLFWMYYTYILVIGLAATSLGSVAFATSVIRFLTVLGIFGHTTTIAVRLHLPALLRADAHTGGLLMEAGEQNEWNRACVLARGHDAVVATDMGDANLMFPEFEKPTAALLLPGIALPNEVEREAERLRQAEIIIVPTNHLPGFPAVSAALADRRRVFDGQYFRVYAHQR
jgi:hypothetical protein